MIDSTESAHALLLLDRHYVVVRIAVDQLDQRVDACLTGHFVHGDGELLMLLLDLVFLQIQEFAVTVENADIDEIVRRDQMFLSLSIRAVISWLLQQCVPGICRSATESRWLKPPDCRRS